MELYLSRRDLVAWGLFQPYCAMLQRTLALIQLPPASLPLSQRSCVLAWLIKQTKTFYEYACDMQGDSLACIPTSIMIHRLRHRDELHEWETVDQALSESFQAKIPICPSSSAVLITELSLRCEADSLKRVKVSCLNLLCLKYDNCLF